MRIGIKKIKLSVALLVALLLLPSPWLPTKTAVAEQAAARATEPLAELLPTAYPTGEILHYDVTWMGLIAGRLTMEIKELGLNGKIFALDISAETAGLLGAIYPVKDKFRVVVEGPRRLPEQYRVDQREGSRQNIKITTYDQKSGRIVYHRNLDEPRRYQVATPIHNEFSAFYAMRIMPLSREAKVIVPTFADHERHEVPVAVEKIETIDSILGRLETMRIKPELRFVGLYEKAGDPQIWLTNDPYRIPLRIRSRIAIGSLVATLSHYEGPFTP